MGKTHESSHNSYPNICSEIEVYRFGGTLQALVRAMEVKGFLPFVSSEIYGGLPRFKTRTFDGTSLGDV